jgi:mannose-1-phosphate guanylyltransferase/mannose-6-phosphate isomerase
MHTIVPVIMSGGAGKRLWPLSTAQKPKQFHALAGARSLIQDTLLRLSGEAEGLRFLPPVIIANAAHADAVAAQARAAGLEPAEIVLEPEGRNTAATAALAALAVQRLAPGALALLAPADHRIADAAGFRAVVAQAAALARSHICTFGITPDRPETGYGYIQIGEALAPGVHAIRCFKEKPDRAQAQAYLDSGDFLWNAGIFAFAPERLLAEFAVLAPEVLASAQGGYAGARRDGRSVWLSDAFKAAPSIAFDVAVMERTRIGAVAPCAVGWADVGSWSEVHRLSAADAVGNVSNGAVLLRGARDCLVLGEGVQVIAADVQGLAIIATRDAVLVAPLDRAQDVKALLEQAAALAATPPE